MCIEKCIISIIMSIILPPALDTDIVSSFIYIKEMEENITGDLEGKGGRKGREEEEQ